MRKTNNRYVELDLLRTFAIIMMIVYHFAYDLESFYGWHLGIFEYWGWALIQHGTASLFLLLVGVSFAISWNRHGITHADLSFPHRYRKYLRRGLGVIACGMLVSAATYWFDPETYVRFGILHLIGVSILLLPFFTRFREWNVAIGSIIIGMQTSILGFFSLAGRRPALVPIGITPTDFFSVDYFPLIPWFGIVLIGYAIGYHAYVRYSWHPFPHARERARWLTWPGRHALLIYLIHQPILLMVLKIV